MKLIIVGAGGTVGSTAVQALSGRHDIVTVGRTSGDVQMDIDDVECAENVLTEPEEVRRFVEQTEVDALAVSIGTAHGVYRSEPQLNIEVLKRLNSASQVPLVLHGGSGTPDDQIQEAVREGIAKINIYTDQRVAMARGLQQFAKAQDRTDPLPQDMFGTIKGALVETLEDKIRLLYADGKAAK